MLRRLAWSALLTAAVWAASTPAATAGCASAVVVDGRLLLGQTLDGREARDALPAVAGTRPAIAPACNDSNGPQERDTRTEVLQLAGVPPQVAVLDRSRETLYRAEGTLTVLPDHPLHRTNYGAEGASFREGRRCRSHRTALTAVALEPATDRGFRADVGKRGTYISVDSATRIVNRPAYAPILARQRLRLHTSLCGPRRVADRIVFAGPAPREDGYEGGATDGFDATGDGGLDVFVVPVVILGAALLLIAVIGVALLGPRGRPPRPR